MIKVDIIFVFKIKKGFYYIQKRILKCYNGYLKNEDDVDNPLNINVVFHLFAIAHLALLS